MHDAFVENCALSSAGNKKCWISKVKTLLNYLDTSINDHSDFDILKLNVHPKSKFIYNLKEYISPPDLLSAAERRGTPVLLSASVSDNFGNSQQIAAPRRSREIDQSTQRFYVGWFHVGWQGIGDQSDAVTQNAWFVAHSVVLPSLEGYQYYIVLIHTGAESWGRFPVPRICHWESTPDQDHNIKGNKLCTYGSFKDNFMYEPYLDLVCNRYERSDLTK